MANQVSVTPALQYAIIESGSQFFFATIRLRNFCYVVLIKLKSLFIPSFTRELLSHDID